MYLPHEQLWEDCLLSLLVKFQINIFCKIVFYNFNFVKLKSEKN